jgi:hypothetical protein
MRNNKLILYSVDVDEATVFNIKYITIYINDILQIYYIINNEILTNIIISGDYAKEFPTFKHITFYRKNGTSVFISNNLNNKLIKFDLFKLNKSKDAE